MRSAGFLQGNPGGEFKTSCVARKKISGIYLALRTMELSPTLQNMKWEAFECWCPANITYLWTDYSLKIWPLFASTPQPLKIMKWLRLWTVFPSMPWKRINPILPPPLFNLKNHLMMRSLLWKPFLDPPFHQDLNRTMRYWKVNSIEG